MALVTPAFFDTSVILPGLIEMGPTSEHPQRVMAAVAEQKIRGVLTAWHCCLEFYSVATRLPEELRLAPADAIRLLEEEVLSRFDVRQLPDRSRRSFLSALEYDRIVGGRTYDAHIAEIARLSGAKVVVTENRRHFSAVLRHGISVVSAGEFIS